jgi:hypothetical protein
MKTKPRRSTRAPSFSGAEPRTSPHRATFRVPNRLRHRDGKPRFSGTAPRSSGAQGRRFGWRRIGHPSTLPGVLVGWSTLIIIIIINLCKATLRDGLLILPESLASLNRCSLCPSPVDTPFCLLTLSVQPITWNLLLWTLHLLMFFPRIVNLT